MQKFWSHTFGMQESNYIAITLQLPCTLSTGDGMLQHGLQDAATEMH